MCERLLFLMLHQNMNEIPISTLGRPPYPPTPHPPPLPSLPPSLTSSLQVASLIGVLFVIGTCLSVFSHFWQYPEWVGPLVMLALIFILFVLPLPLLKHKSRLWLGKEIVCTKIMLYVTANVCM